MRSNMYRGSPTHTGWLDIDLLHDIQLTVQDLFMNGYEDPIGQCCPRIQFWRKTQLHEFVNLHKFQGSLWVTGMHLLKLYMSRTTMVQTPGTLAVCRRFRDCRQGSDLPSIV
jgi:hypothetical protein